ncbi:M15 family metallopeptidase [Fastidiosibacter lacustris]|uniref:M15 family metallopeptidase n=1 Tax=Fastidiosibacter lacustris TaxID=2056695 RepID=UPI001956C48E|nr:M15 family metallopeptidase [Fastidiosibacter lacustris]
MFSNGLYKMNQTRKIIFLLVALGGGFFYHQTSANQTTIIKEKPSDFINIKSVIPTIQVSVRYYTDNNFVGRRIKGYETPVCLLTKKATLALKKVQDQLLPMGLSLKVYDCYRPQTAVNDFADWAENLNETQMRTEYYPTVDKSNLFKEGYIDYHSGHSRGSTVDLTIIPLDSKIPIYDPKKKQAPCTSAQHLRSPDNSLDFGTGFDCFSPMSHPSYQNLSPQIKANRLLLRTLMIEAGFKPLETEWWHFTLKEEPYPKIYFDFPVQ